MKIVDCRKTRITGNLLRELMPDSLKDFNVVLNLGSRCYNINHGFYKYNEQLIINNNQGVRNCSNKIRMFNILKRNGVKCLDFYRPGEISVLNRIKYVYTIGKKKKIARGMFRKWDYCTMFERKMHEFRVVIFKGKILRITHKLPEDGNMDKLLKMKNCRFKHATVARMRSDVKRECLKAVEVLGIDLCGVDVLVNMDNEVKVIEVNSGPGLGERTAGRLFRAIERMVGLI